MWETTSSKFVSIAERVHLCKNASNYFSGIVRRSFSFIRKVTNEGGKAISNQLNGG